jgi:hypothetical protein
MALETKLANLVKPRSLDEKLAALTDEERDAYNNSLKNPPLSPNAAMQYCRLFIQGYTTAEIARQNPSLGLMGPGLMVRARVEFDWDAQRDAYINSLMSSARRGCEKTTLEAIQLMSDGMAAYHLLVGEKFRTFLRTGNPDDLGEWKDTFSFEKYRKMLDTLQALTGQVQAAAKQSPTFAEATPAPGPTQTIEGQSLPKLVANQPVSPKDAATMLEFLLKDEKK